MTLRAARPADLQSLSDIESECFGTDAWSASSVADELSGVPQTRYVVVAESDDGLEGYASLLAVGRGADVQRIAVRPRARRCGLGHALLSRLLDQAQARRCEQVMLEVRADNEAAIALYTDLGFTDLHRRAGYYGDGVDALVMRRPL